MELETQQHPLCDIVTVRGDVTATNVPTLEKTLQTYVNLGRYRILLDLRACTYISSAGLSFLVTFANNCRRWNRGDLCLVDPPAYILNLLRLAGLLSPERSFFRIFPSIAEGVKAFGEQVEE